MLDQKVDLAFQTLVRKRDPHVFSFIRKHNVDFNLNDFFVRLLKIDLKQTVDWVIYKCQNAQSKDSDRQIDACVQAIGYHYRNEMEQAERTLERDRVREAMLKEAEFQKFIFLQELFDKNKTLGKQYHQD
jgi:hypothetical protein